MKVELKVMCKLLIGMAASFCVHNSKAQDYVKTDSIIHSNRIGLENLLKGQVSGVLIKNWSGLPNAQSIVNIRAVSLDPTDGNTLPLILVNGVPLIATPSSVTGINPLSYFSPEQVERIEVIKDASKLARYGVLAANGAINVIIKEGNQGPLNVNVSAIAGADFISDYKDSFYQYSPAARKNAYTSGTIIQEQNALIDGGGEYGSYMFGLNNYKSSGTIKDSDFNRHSLFLNAKYKISDNLSMDFYNNFALANRNGRYSGEYKRDLSSDKVLDESFFMDDKKNVAVLSSLQLQYRFSPNLVLSSKGGLSYEGSSRDSYIPSNLLNGNIFAQSIAYKRQLLNVVTELTYQKELSERFDYNLVVGNEIRNSDYRLTSVEGARSMESGGSDYVKIVTGYNANQTNAFSDRDLQKLVSFYGIWTANWDRRLDIDVTLRADGSSLYNEKWALYPAVGLQYDLSHSLHFPIQVQAGWSKTGILNGFEKYRGELFGFGEYYSRNELGVGQLYPAFKDARSISVYQYDAGLSSNLSDRTRLSLTYFSKEYKDFTYKRYLSNFNGIDYQYELGAGLKISGLEFDLSSDLIQKENFSWLGSLNIAYHKNQVRQLPSDIGNTSLASLSVLDKKDPITSIIAYENNVTRIIGDSRPNLFGGLTNTFNWNDFTASVIFTYSYGADAVLTSYTSQYQAHEVTAGFPVKAGETPYYFIDQQSNGDLQYQGISEIQNASYLQLNRALLSYKVRPLMDKWSTIKDFRAFVRGENLLTISNYKGINPEENINGIRRSDLMHTGTPLPSSLVLGIKVTF